MSYEIGPYVVMYALNVLYQHCRNDVLCPRPIILETQAPRSHSLDGLCLRTNSGIHNKCTSIALFVRFRG